MMKRRVEHSHLRQTFTKQFACRQNSFHIVWIVQGRQIDALLDALEHPIIDQCRFLKQLPAMHHAMSYGVHISRALDLPDARALRDNVPKQIIECGSHISQRSSQSRARLLPISHPDDSFAANSLD